MISADTATVYWSRVWYGLYIEEWEIGIRIEDDVLVTAEGNEVMTAAMLKTVDEIEAFMAKE